MVTAKELAKKIGLSEAAVSLALNNKPGVSTTTRNMVIATARELGYDFSKKEMSSGIGSGTIGFAIYKKSGAVVGDTPFFSLLSDGVGLECKRNHYNLVITYLFDDDSFETSLFRLKNSGISGLILLATEMDSQRLPRFSGLGFPVVILDAYFENVQFNYVLINNIQGAYLATSYLISKRKDQPGYLKSSYPIANFDERADGFYKAIRSNGMSASKSPVHLLTPSEDGAYEEMKEFLDTGEKPASCYFADNDLIAIGAIRALKEAGYKIPEDVAVIGFDDLPLCEFLNPPLTTVDVPKSFMGATAAQRIIGLINDKNSLPIKVEIATSLKKRKSV